MEKQIPFMRRFNAINDATNMAYHNLSQKLGFSDGEAIILYAMYDGGSVTQKEIAARTGMSKQTVSSAVRQLVQKNLLKQPKGLRNEPLRLTGEGQKALEEKISLIVHVENSILSDWTPEEQQQFLTLNERYLDSMRKEINKLTIPEKE